MLGCKIVWQDRHSSKKDKENKGKAWTGFIETIGLLHDHFKSSREKKSDEDECVSLNNRMLKEEESRGTFTATVSFLQFLLWLLRKN